MPTPPHLILVVVDGLGWRMTGWSDNPYAETPFMDKLVKDDSLILDRMYGQANCAPARAALLTGRVAARAGILNYPVSIYGVSEKLTLLPNEIESALVSEISIARPMWKQRSAATETKRRKSSAASLGLDLLAKTPAELRRDVPRQLLEGLGQGRPEHRLRHSDEVLLLLYYCARAGELDSE